VCLWAPAIAFAQGSPSLTEADRIYDTGDIDGALEAYETALQISGNEVDEVLHIHRRLGLLRAATGNTAQARTHFAIAIAINPEASAPSELSPENRVIWDEMRSQQRPIALELRCPEANEGAHARLEVAVSNTPAGAVRSLRIFVGTATDIRWETRVSGVGPHSVLMPPSIWDGAQAVTVRLQALDPHGGVIAQTQSPFTLRPTPAVELGDNDATEAAPDETEPSVESPLPTGSEEPDPNLFTAPPPVEEDEDERSSIWASPWLWAITGVVIAGATTTAVVLGSSTVPRYGAPTIEYGAAP